MEYQELTNLLKNTPNQPSKFRPKSWVEVNDKSAEIITLIVKLSLKPQC